MTWGILNSTVGLAAALLIAWELVFYHTLLTLWERVGKGCLGAWMVMSMGPLLVRSGEIFSYPATPFDDWPGFLGRVGCIILVLARIMRHRKHELANKQQIEIAKNHFAQRSGGG